MMPLIEAPSGALMAASARMIHAAAIVRRAAEALARERPPSRETSRYQRVACRLGRVLAAPEVDHQKLLLASPAVLEQTGRSRTLVEMIEAEPGDEEARLRLAKLLLRALIWRAETIPDRAD